MSNSNEIQALLHGYAAGRLSAAEEKLLMEWVNDPEKALLIEEALAGLISKRSVEASEPSKDNAMRAAEILTVDKDMDVIPYPVRRVSFLRRWYAAAAIILLLGGGAYLWNQKLKVKNEDLKVAETGSLKNDITPGKEGAILTLADGSQVVLDSLGNGVVALQNGSQAVIKNGELVYDVTGNAAGDVVYNTMFTPKGRQFRVTLPDGTGVWLNAASSIRYPTVFRGSERVVEVTGEAYFEVTKNSKMPFRLKVNNKMEVDVLGTSFNVNAYDNEKTINTTLIEGLVRVSSGGKQMVIRPGEQAQTDDAQQRDIVVGKANIEKVMAWKNGRFHFENAPLEEVLHQLERWYDIDVVYAGKIPDKRFWGEMGMDLQLDDVLQFLKKSNVKFTYQQGKTIVVSE